MMTTLGKSTEPKVQEDTIKISKDSSISNTNSKTQLTVQYIENSEKEKFLNVDKDIWTNFIFPLSIFLLGLFLSFIIKKTNAFFSNKRLKTFITTWIKLIRTPLEKQEKDFLEFSNAVNTIDSFPAGLGIHNLHASKLKSIDPKELKLLILDNLIGSNTDKTMLLYRLSTQIEYLDKVQEGSIEFLKNYKLITKDIYDEWNINIVKFNEELNNIFINDSVDIKTDAFLSKIYPIQDRWKKSSDIDKQTYIRDSLLEPIISFCHDYLQKTSFKDKRPIPFLKAAENLRTTIRKNSVHVESTSAKFMEYSRNMRSSRKGLYISMRRLDSMCLKLYCR